MINMLRIWGLSAYFKWLMFSCFSQNRGLNPNLVTGELEQKGTPWEEVTILRENKLMTWTIKNAPLYLFANN